jgi:hypothetical protein
MGIVMRPDGTPLSQVLVTVHLLDSIYRKGYAYTSATTGTDGRFQAADVVRLAVAPSLGSMDTVTAYVVANASGAIYKPGVDGAFPTDSVSVLIRFYPEGQAPTASTVIVRVAVP